jgi:putative membrane protein
MSTDAQMNSDARHFEIKANAESHFSWLRTRMSLERTLMSWVRTATALIGFGFTIVQFFERIKSSEGVRAAAFPDAPRYLGLALILTGVMALLLSIWQYRTLMRYLWSSNFAPLAGTADEPGQTPLLATSVVLVVIGAFAFVSVLLRVF